jgi:chemosensory pili system protein ChpA (sensor histidine kinase/response regulator)
LLLQQSRINTDLQEGLMRSRMVPFSRLAPRLRRIVRQVSNEVGKKVNLVMENIEGEMDRTLLEKMLAPFEHMLRNAVDHGIEDTPRRLAAGKSEVGTVSIELAREGGEVVIRLTDDGQGLNIDAIRDKAITAGLMAPDAGLTDHEIQQFILEAGLSTASEVTQLSGRGVGMDVVSSEIKQLGGTVDIHSELGIGTEFEVRLPFTVSVNRALMVQVAGDTYALPLNTIEGIARISPFELEAYFMPDAPLFEYGGQGYDLRYMGSMLHLSNRPNLEGITAPLPVVLVRSADHAVAIQVDSLLGSREVVVKTLGLQFNAVPGLAGATVTGDGSVIVILDLHSMIRAEALSAGTKFIESDIAEVKEERNQLVMVVDDSVTVRKVASRFLERNGKDVFVAKDGVEAMAILQDRKPDVMLLDIEMPRMDGFEVASRVKRSQSLKDIKIIMITSRTGEKHRERAMALGVDYYLGKPYQEAELLALLEEIEAKVEA